MGLGEGSGAWLKLDPCGYCSPPGIVLPQINVTFVERPPLPPQFGLFCSPFSPHGAPPTLFFCYPVLFPSCASWFLRLLPYFSFSPPRRAGSCLFGSVLYPSPWNSAWHSVDSQDTLLNGEMREWMGEWSVLGVGNTTSWPRDWNTANREGSEVHGVL